MNMTTIMGNHENQCFNLSPILYFRFLIGGDRTVDHSETCYLNNKHVKSILFALLWFSTARLGVPCCYNISIIIHTLNEKHVKQIAPSKHKVFS